MIKDLPLRGAQLDRLGFAGTAEHLADAFLQNSLENGFVIGVEGAWGSGKSSLVQIALDRISVTPNGPIVIRFKPWLVGSRTELLRQLFIEFEHAISLTLPAEDVPEVKALLEKFSKLASGAAFLAELGDAGGIPFMKIASRLFERTSEATAELADQSLSELSEQLRLRLQKLKRPVVVFIDDLDRLEPNEAVEVLRLVRAVADFPNVGYILAYDKKVIADALERCLQISDGRRYLEKVIQASVSVPQANPFDLRSWVEVELLKLIGDMELSDTAKVRLDDAILEWTGKLIVTPRDVVRTINGMRLHFVPIRDRLDPADAFFLEVVRTKMPELYGWVEEYIPHIAELEDFGSIEKSVPNRLGRRLLEIIAGDIEEKALFLRGLSAHLPGLGQPPTSRSEGDFRVYEFVPPSRRHDDVSDRRLGSPSHYRYYFAFTRPTGSIDERQFQKFVSDCLNAPSQALSTMRSMAKDVRPQGSTYADLLVNMLAASREQLTSTEARSVLSVVTKCSDEIASNASSYLGGPKFIGMRKDYLIGLIVRLNDAEMFEALVEIVSSPASIAWSGEVMIELSLRKNRGPDDLFENEIWRLSGEQVEKLQHAYLKKLEELGFEALLRSPSVMRSLTAWRYLIGDGAVQKWVAEHTGEDEQLVRLLEALRSWSQSSALGTRLRLRRETLGGFFGEEEAVLTRLDKIAKNEGSDSGIDKKAREMLENLDEK